MKKLILILLILTSIQAKAAAVWVYDYKDKRYKSFDIAPSNPRYETNSRDRWDADRLFYGNKIQRDATIYNYSRNNSGIYDVEFEEDGDLEIWEY